MLWCSTTGNAESLAARCVGQLTDAGIPAEASCMAGTEVSQLVAAEYVLLVASTFGDGDPPDNGSAFWQVLASESAPRLESLHFSVLALGDSSYDQFCGFGRSLDERLSALGATRLLPHAECDGQIWPRPVNGLRGSVSVLPDRESRRPRGLWYR
ncbi:flavodoxin domain-containing protein [Tatumella ptyseos]|uniref:Sulfite reductase [NADPH] flavoprotein alpha-component n=1 Tax=Tatumella ptyseos TaxID=82987 RepID=A0A2X5NV50_9GAMM|nr:Sulfite reductase [NADPH] flavoprotein alpha-component [Tatumella ptyseos]